MSNAEVFKVLPVALEYQMGGLLDRCLDTAEAALCNAPTTHPSLMKWLCLAKDTQSDALLTACLANLEQSWEAPLLKATMVGLSGQWRLRVDVYVVPCCFF